MDAGESFSTGAVLVGVDGSSEMLVTTLAEDSAPWKAAGLWNDCE
jgi:hypothetical protein